jgi:hypothetical protein
VDLKNHRQVRQAVFADVGVVPARRPVGRHRRG